MNVIDAIRMRRSVRSFRPQPIPDDAMGALTEAFQTAFPESGLLLTVDNLSACLHWLRHLLSSR